MLMWFELITLHILIRVSEILLKIRSVYNLAIGVARVTLRSCNGLGVGVTSSAFAHVSSEACQT